MSELLGEAERIARLARQRGADEAEAYVWRSREVEANVVGRMPASRVSETVGLGLRVVRGGRMGHASCTGLQERAVAHAIAAALASGQHAPESAEPARLPDATRGSGPAGPWDGRVAEAEPADVTRLAEDVVRDMLQEDVRFASALLLHQDASFAVASTRGVAVEERGTSNRLLAECRVRRGTEERTGNDQRVARRKLDLAGAGQACVQRARASLGAQPIPPAERAVLLDPATSAALFQLLGPALAGPDAREGRTFLSGKLGRSVAPPWFTLRDAPGSGGPRAQAWDDEGTPSRNQPLIERGVLRGWLDHGSRLRVQEERHRAPPVVAPMNLAPEAGTKPFEGLVAQAGEAIVVRHVVMGLGHANGATGAFSLVAPSAWLVRRGEVVHALPPVTLAGNAADALRGLVALSRDVAEGVVGQLPGAWLDRLATAC